MTSQAGPFDQWPIGMGFEYFYGFNGGETNQWQPDLYRNTTRIYPYVGNPNYNLTTDMADEAIAYLNQLNELDPKKPFFLYYAPGGTHAPHHPTPEWIEKFKGKFSMGWNALRDQIFANQKKLGVIPQDAELTPWPSDILKNWDDLNIVDKKLFERQMEVYAAYLAYTDHEIGRVVQAVEDMGKLDNTLIIYISGDNGGSAEGSPVGTPNEMTFFNGVEVPVAEQLKFYEKWGSQYTYPHMAVGWTWAMSTPYKWTKQIPSYFGGIRNGMAIAWPGHIADAGGIRNQFHHVVDIVPTILEVTGIRAPETVDGITQTPIEGVSLAYTFDKANASAPSTHKTQYFEMFGNRALYHDGWIASTVPYREPWNGTAPTPKDVVNGRQMGAVRSDQGLDAEPRSFRGEPREAERAAGSVLGRGGQVSGPAARCIGADPLHPSPPEHRRRPDRVHLYEADRRRAAGHGAERSQQVLQDHSRYRSARRRRQRHAGDGRRALRRLGILSAQGKAGLRL